MDELERKLVFNESLEEKTKIFRNQSITCIEDFSNEIFYEIFDYFDGCEIVETFSNLNSQFEQLLYSSSLLIKTHFYLFHHQEMMTPFNELEIFPNKICTTLKILSINCSNDITFLDAHQWERLILHYYPQLEKFYFTYYDRLDNDNQYPIYSGKINQFSSSFWIERQWLFEAKVRDADIEYTIRPYSKRCYDDRQDNSVDCSIEYSKLPGLTLARISGCIFEGVIPKTIERVLSISQIYHLEILQKKVSMSVLIQAVNRLPDITTLKIHSLSTDKTTELPVKELLILCSMTETSKITKVNLEEIDNLQELDFLFTISPYMECFKVGCINAIDVQSLLRTAFRKINHNNRSLRTLCFDAPTADHHIVENIEEMIKCEKLLPDFTVKHILDTVYLQWI